jgi:Circularly permutated YpsA SLOG family
VNVQPKAISEVVKDFEQSLEKPSAPHETGLRGGRQSGNPLRESPSASYLQRTEWNVRDSNATVLFSLASELTGGSSSLKSISSLGFIWRPAISTALRGSKIGWRKNQLMS